MVPALLSTRSPLLGRHALIGCSTGYMEHDRALMSFYAPDAVCDMSPIGLGVYQNPRAIRGRGLP